MCAVLRDEKNVQFWFVLFRSWLLPLGRRIIDCFSHIVRNAVSPLPVLCWDVVLPGACIIVFRSVGLYEKSLGCSFRYWSTAAVASVGPVVLHGNPQFSYTRGCLRVLTSFRIVKPTETSLAVGAHGSVRNRARSALTSVKPCCCPQVVRS